MDLLQRLGRAVDQPGFPWKTIILGFNIDQYLLESYLSYRQYQVLKLKKPPVALQECIDQPTFEKSQDYARAKAKFGFATGLFGQMQNLYIFYGDVLPRLWGFSGGFLAKYGPSGFTGEITQTLVFLQIFNLISLAFALPQTVYYTFVLEEKYGFNQQTPKIFITDILKTQLLTMALGGPILAAFLKIIQTTGDGFFYYLWLFTIALSLVMITVYPIFILPLFNKLTPLQPGTLKVKVEALAKRLSFPLNALYEIDGSKRSAHSNAYFFGLPWKKHIVIYDTLIQKSSADEVVAVLAHELGHWSLGHTSKLFLISQAHTFYIFSLFSLFIHNASLYHAFGFPPGMQPIIIGLVLFSDILAPLDTVVKLLMNVLSRRFEWQADDFAKQLGYADDLARSLIKLQVQNLSTMHADPWYASYHFSHPILPERLGPLGWKGGEIEGLEKVAPGSGESKSDVVGDTAEVLRAGDREL